MGGAPVTLDQAQKILGEQFNQAQLVDMYAVDGPGELHTPAYWIIARADGKPLATGPTWQETFATFTGQAPI